MPFDYHSRKYTLNENFFSYWSSDMAYVLGFWFADNRKQTDLRSNFTSGSPKFLNALRDLLTKKLELYPRKVCVYGNGNQWKLGYGCTDTIKLLKFMYYPKCILYLTRKEAYSHYQRINRSLWKQTDK